ALIEHARNLGGIVTVLWHDRSHGPERFWGDFYIRLVEALRSLDAWFATAAQVVGWFRKRREVRFDRVEAPDGTARTCLRYQGEQILPPLTIRVHRDGRSFDTPRNGETVVELDHLLHRLAPEEPSALSLR